MNSEATSNSRDLRSRSPQSGLKAKGLSVEWFTECKTPEEKEEYATLLRNSPLVLQGVKRIVGKWDDEITKCETSTQEYTNPAWPYLQASRNGQRLVIKRIQELLKFI